MPTKSHFIPMQHHKISVALPVLILSLLLPALASAQTNSIPPELRAGNFSCDKATIQTAVELKHAGWTYIMLEPKSPQAAWGNHDGRTTWWVGYWVNDNDRSTSSGQPKKDENGKLVAQTGSTDLFIFPPHQFQHVDLLFTNFHLPRSTLLMLVSAFAGQEFLLRAYRDAIRERYRFYSYGDCMLIL